MDSSLKSECFKVIAEQIKDNNVVTFKWLSRKLEIHNSVAKQLMQQYLDESEDKTKYIVTLVVYGKKDEGDLLLSLVKESEFPNLQKTISIIDKHVYSIQPVESTFNPDMIYNIDKATYELKQLSLSSIKYSKEIIRKSTSLPSIPTIKSENSFASTEKSNSMVKGKSIPKKESPKKQCSPKKESPPSKSNKEVNTKPESRKSIIKPIANNKASISSFFQKQVAKGVTKKPNSAQNDESSGNQETPVLDKTKDEKQVDSESEKNDKQIPETKRMKTESDPKTSTEKSPKTNGVTKTIETERLAQKIDQKSNSSKRSQNKSKSKKSKSKKTTKQKKMKRIILQSDSSSDDEASDHDSHVSEPEPEEEPEPVIKSPIKESPAVIISHGKKRKRKIIDKTVIDDDGFLCTTKETVYESCSSDENEDHGTNNENVDNNKRFKSEENNTEIKSKASNEEVVKTQSQKTKQASIMSFFKKPSKT